MLVSHQGSAQSWQEGNSAGREAQGGAGHNSPLAQHSTAAAAKTCCPTTQAGVHLSWRVLHCQAHNTTHAHKHPTTLDQSARHKLLTLHQSDHRSPVTSQAPFRQPLAVTTHLLRPLMPATALTPAVAAAVSTPSSCCRQSNAPTLMIRGVEGPRADTRADVSRDTCGTTQHRCRPRRGRGTAGMHTQSSASAVHACDNTPLLKKRRICPCIMLPCWHAPVPGLPQP